MAAVAAHEYAPPCMHEPRGDTLHTELGGRSRAKRWTWEYLHGVGMVAAWWHGESSASRIAKTSENGSKE